MLDTKVLLQVIYNVVYDNFQDILGPWDVYSPLANTRNCEHLPTFRLFIHATETTNLWSQHSSSWSVEAEIHALANS